LEINALHLDEIIDWINGTFGQVTPDAEFSADMETLKNIFGDGGYQRYLQDQVNRQIIRDYLINAMVLEIISEGGLPAFAAQISSEEGRATMALYMLMSSVEDAQDLPAINGDIEVLKPLEPAAEPPSYIKLVPS
jgi:hypothetical protein